MEAGECLPSLSDFMHLSAGLGEPPAILLAEIITDWRHDPTDIGLYKSRPSDLTRLYRLGYFYDAGDFRELTRTYELLDHATADARRVRVFRANRQESHIDTLTVYVRVGHIRVDTRPESGLTTCSKE